VSGMVVEPASGAPKNPIRGPSPPVGNTGINLCVGDVGNWGIVLSTLIHGPVHGLKRLLSFVIPSSSVAGSPIHSPYDDDVNLNYWI
jgi:hypothetical protein